MKKIVFSLLFINTLGFAQTEKSVGDFNKVTSFDQIDVILIPGKENKVLLTGKDSEQVELVNKKGELKLRMPMTQLLKGDNISATVYYKTIDAVEANEGSSIASEAVFKSTMFDIIAKEGSQVKLKLDVSKLTARVSNGSTVSLDGSATNQDVLVNSGGLYQAKKLVTNQTVITVNAGGESDVNAKELVDAKVRAGGDITIYGKPKQINQKVIAGGSIQEAK
ncbi:head GIN domain-containing protein [Flavobacterium sp. SUN046]|uniref:head GIN domain-containing protein n=1 Tax=Flavobacterium sp. SUN046 TaxID=3002440 RepID=UPI002DBC7482|nr:head GIN domain-containing protein [Flavobacterium sp. SUN046]MEC4048173.1 head GIN domain-containing protein [Flavobacterium sp. SUN046]